MYEITLDGTEDWLALTRYDEDYCDNTWWKVDQTFADWLNQEVITVWEPEGLHFELGAESRDLFDILYVIKPSLNTNGKA